MGGSLGALKSAINSNGIAGNMAGVHTMPTTPKDQVIVYLMIWQFVQGLQRDYKTVNNVLIIDLDVHQGDGTASIFSNDDSVLLSMHCESNFPLKMVSDLDIPLKKGMEMKIYINILKLNLDRLSQIPSDIIFFQAGVDVLDSDGLGHYTLVKVDSLNEIKWCWILQKDKPTTRHLYGRRIL